MSARVSARGPGPRLLLAAGLAGLVLAAAGPTRAQQAQQGPAGGAGLFIGVVVDVEKADAGEKAAVEKAKAYFAKLKEDAAAKKAEEERAAAGQPPSYPDNPDLPADVGGVTPAAVAAAVLPPTGVGEALAAGLPAAPAKPAPALFFWTRVTNPRHLYLLGLDPLAEKDPDLPVRQEWWKAAAEARAKGEPFAHPRKGFNWLVFTRAGAAGRPLDVFVLVRRPEAKALVTERELLRVEPLPDDVAGFFTLEGGVEKLRALTAEAKDRVLAVSVNGDARHLMRTPSKEIDSGRLRLGSGLQPDDLQRLRTDLETILSQRRPR